MKDLECKIEDLAIYIGMSEVKNLDCVPVMFSIQATGSVHDPTKERPLSVVVKIK